MRLIWPLVLALVLASHGYAASLAHVYEPVQMPNGEAVSGASVYVYQPNTTTQVTIYEDAAGESPITQPETTSSGGMMSFYIGSGTYDIHVEYAPWGIDTTWEDYNAFLDSGGLAVSPITLSIAPVGVTSDRTLYGSIVPRDCYLLGASGAIIVTSVSGTVPVVVSARQNGEAVLSDTMSVSATGTYYWEAAPAVDVALADGDTLDGYIDVTGTITYNPIGMTVEMQYDR